MGIKQKFRSIGTIFKNTFRKWNESDPFRQSAIIAYYAIFSLPALLVLVINVAGFFFQQEAVSGEITGQIESVVGKETASQVGNIVKKAGETKAGIIPGLIAIFAIILGATGVFIQLQKSLNQIWEVKEKPNAGFKKMLKNRLFSFGLILSIGFLLLTSLVISSLLAATSNWLEGVFPSAIANLFYALEFVVSLGVISVLFALMFKFLPDVKLKWNNLWVGSILTGLLFMIGKYGLSFYFGKAEPASVYGAAGSVILVLLWVSYSSMIVFFGAEFTKQYAVYHGLKIEPTNGAVKLNVDPGNETKERISEKATDSEELKKESVSQKHAHDFYASGTTMFHEKQAHPDTNKLHKYNGQKINSIKELHAEINRMENRLEEDKDEIKDDLKLSHIIIGILPRALRLKYKRNGMVTLDDYLKAIAKFHITPVRKEPTLMDKIKKLINMGSDNNGKEKS